MPLCAIRCKFNSLKLRACSIYNCHFKWGPHLNVTRRLLNQKINISTTKWTLFRGNKVDRLTKIDIEARWNILRKEAKFMGAGDILIP